MISTELYHHMRKELELKRSYNYFAENIWIFCSQNAITTYFETPVIIEWNVRVRLVKRTPFKPVEPASIYRLHLGYNLYFLPLLFGSP